MYTLGKISDSNVIKVTRNTDGVSEINALYTFQDISADDISANSITTIGNVGIGTNAPDTKLHVKGSGDKE